MEETINQVGQFLASLISVEALLDYAGVLIKIVLVVVIIMAIKRILIKTVDSVLQNKVTMTMAKSDKFDGIEEKRLTTLGKLFKSIIAYSLYFIAIITVLDMIGIKITTVLAGAGIVSLAVAFGAQSIVKDLMSGLFIILENQYAVGEYVNIDGTVGKVTEIGMKTTKIATYEGEMMVIPNGNIGQLVNYSRDAQRGTVDVGVAYEENIDNAIRVINEACEKVNLEYPTQISEHAAVLGVVELADSSVVIRATFTAYNWEHFKIERELRKAIKDEMDEQGVEISYPKLRLM